MFLRFKSAILVVFFLFCLVDAFSQKYNFEFSLGYDYSSLTFDESIKIDDRSRRAAYPESYRIAFSKQIKQFFYIKSELGVNRISHSLVLNYGEDNPKFRIRRGAITAEYEKNNYYAGIFPEVRFLKNIIFLNVGYSLFFYQESKLTDIKHQFFIIEFLGNEISRGGISDSFSANVGINPKYKKFGLLLSLGFQEIRKNYDVRELLLGVGVRQVIYHLGLTYSFD
jgi:hypothetical protein